VLPDPPAGFRIDLIDDNRLDESFSVVCGKSMSAAANDRLRVGDRKEAGDNDDCLSLAAAIDVKGASRFSFVNEDDT